jgi:hypothetical protein
MQGVPICCRLDGAWKQLPRLLDSLLARGGFSPPPISPEITRLTLCAALLTTPMAFVRHTALDTSVTDMA